MEEKHERAISKGFEGSVDDLRRSKFIRGRLEKYVAIRWFSGTWDKSKGLQRRMKLSEELENERKREQVMVDSEKETGLEGPG